MQQMMQKPAAIVLLAIQADCKENVSPCSPAERQAGNMRSYLLTLKALLARCSPEACSSAYTALARH